MKHDFRKYLNPYFIETGSYMGDGIQAAVDAGFETIISIELSEKYYNICRSRFKIYSNVDLLAGSSVYWLPIILNMMDDKCTFWLDAHYSGGDTSQGVPLMKELRIITAYPDRHTILIDDMRLFRNPPDNWDIDFNDKDIEKALADYDISYEYGVAENDILIAR